MIKKIIPFTLFFVLSYHFCFAQSYQKGNITIDPGIGIGIYGLNTNDATDTNSAAASWLLPVSVEYGISDKFAIGILFERNGFIVGRDSTDTGDSASFRSLNFGVKGVYHFVNNEKTTFFTELVIGYSALRVLDKTKQGIANNSEIKANGRTIQLSVGFKNYFSEYIGWFLNIGFASYYYKYIYNHSDNIVAGEDNRWLTSDGKDFKSISLKGANIRTGITLKF